MVIISKPAPLSLSGNLDKFRLGADSNVSFVLSQGDETILSTVYSPGADRVIEIDVRDVIHGRLQFLFKDVKEVYEQTLLVADFKAVMDTEEYIFRVIRCGVDVLSITPALFLQANFLTWQKQVKKVTYYTPEYLTYYAVSDCLVMVRAFFQDNAGAVTAKTIRYASLSSGKAYTIPVSYPNIESLCEGAVPGAYDVWVENVVGDRLSYVQRYVADGMGSEEEQWFMFENSLGGMDTFRAYGATEFTGEHTHNVAEMGDISVEYRVDAERMFKKSTGYLDKKERTWLLDFFPSQRKYVYTTNYLRQIVVIESNVEYESHELPSEFKFTYKYADAMPFLNMQRVEVPELLTVKSPDLMSFTVPPRLIDFPSQPLSEGALFPVQNPFSERWSTTTIGAILSFLLNTISESYDGAGGVGHIHANKPVLDSLSLLEGYLFSEGKKINVGYADMAGDVSDDSPLFGKVLRKDITDTAAELVTFLKGFLIGKNGSGITVLEDGTTQAVVDRLNVKLKATFDELEVKKKTHVGGGFIVSPSGMKCIKVENLDDAYRCYFLSEQDGVKIENDFTVGALAISQKCNLKEGVSEGTSTHFYWRLVTAVGEDHIDLSKTVCLEESDIPQVGDDIAGFGHNTDVTRQSAIVISAVNENSPSITFYEGINSFSTVGKESIALGFNRITGKSYLRVYGDAYIGSQDKSSYIEYTIENGVSIKGKLHVTSGSTGAKNFDDLPEVIQEAADGMSFGKYNLLRNTGFTGDFISKQLQEDTELDEGAMMFSPPLDHWDAVNVVVQDSSVSESGKKVSIHAGSLMQTLFYKLMSGESYVLSFKAKGTSLTYSCGGVSKTLELTSEYVRHVEKFNAESTGEIFSITNATCTICEIQLERGTVVSAWGNSMLDNSSELAYYESLKYLQSAIHDASSTTLGGLNLANIMLVGNYVDGKMKEITGGISGIYNDENSVFAFGGGDLEAAIRCVAMFKDDPSYQPTDEELSGMAKIVLTHGGRAILNDVILRGYIYALGGRFQGEVIADSGVFKNISTPNKSLKIDEEGNVKGKDFELENVKASGTIGAGSGSKIGNMQILDGGATLGQNSSFINAHMVNIPYATNVIDYSKTISGSITQFDTYLISNDRSDLFQIKLPSNDDIINGNPKLHGNGHVFRITVSVGNFFTNASKSIRIVKQGNMELYDRNGNAVEYFDMRNGMCIMIQGIISSLADSRKILYVIL